MMIDSVSGDVAVAVGEAVEVMVECGSVVVWEELDVKGDCSLCALAEDEADMELVDVCGASVDSDELSGRFSPSAAVRCR